MKKLILLFLVIIPLVSSITEVKENIKLNEVVTVEGKNLKIISANLANDLLVEVDGITGIVSAGKEKIINDMGIKVSEVIYFDRDNILATLNIIVKHPCGDSLCNDTETSESCCTDCGCKNNLICSNNICQKNQCELNKNCDDNDTCTTDLCEGSPKKCSNEKIEQCSNDDNCCLSSCNFQNDNDCLPPSDECNETEDCNDRNYCTSDNCEGIPKKCTHETIGYCILNENCFNEGEINNKKYCSKEGWKEQKKKYQTCSNNYECLNNNCDQQYCGGILKRRTTIIITTLIIILTIAVGIYFITFFREG